MTFTGFQQKLPEYEVLTPQGNQSFLVRSLTVQEEEKLKGSVLTPQKITEHLNKCIYEVITQSPDNINSFDNFLKNVTLRDREALLFGIHHISYEEIRNYQVQCSNPRCGKSYGITTKASDTFNMNPYPYDDILKRRENFQLPVYQKVMVTLKQPTLKDEITGLKDLGSRPGSNTDQIVTILPICGIYEVDDNNEPIQSFEQQEDILDAYKALPSKDKKEINKKYTDEFGQYGLDLKVKTVCESCGEEQEVVVDIVDNFFSMVYSD